MANRRWSPWPRCDKRDCQEEASFVDPVGRGWCVQHQHPEAQLVHAVAQFDGRWLWQQIGKPVAE